MTSLFYIFIFSLLGAVILFSFRYSEYVYGESTILGQFREKSDTFLLRISRILIKKGRDAWYFLEREAPLFVKKIYLAIRSSWAKTFAKKVLASLSLYVNNLLLVLLKFFGRLRKKAEELHSKHRD